MRNAIVLLAKFITCIVAFAVALDLFFDATITDILSFSLLVTIVSYVVGELMLLPRIGNWKAVAVDFLLVYASVWIFGNVVLDNYMQIAWGSIIAAFIILVAEIFVHRYLLNDAESRGRKGVHANRQSFAYGTEMAEEDNIHDLNPKKK
ncbi:membrane protein [Weizmannia acidilactici]|uniref:Membrane protein n=1 Tax=Weizmannia acidilactici TaxID=2607726 RepID=A0A5J4JD63_9BACI|nr:YndM family protein [Weizmannia acidilactici]GER66154.1 membrane protein [Weizmannia acidilactici]GER69209.1 membrane protein [Weizmannia acidilactici]GER72094.1 membrane protein [Weizmannia acidilactici]